MFKSRYALIALVLSLFSATLSAQTAVNVEISGHR